MNLMSLNDVGLPRSFLDNLDMYWVYYIICSSAACWTLFVFVVVLCFLPDLLIHIFENSIANLLTKVSYFE